MHLKPFTQKTSVQIKCHEFQCFQNIGKGLTPLDLKLLDHLGAALTDHPVKDKTLTKSFRIIPCTFLIIDYNPCTSWYAEMPFWYLLFAIWSCWVNSHKTSSAVPVTVSCCTTVTIWPKPRAAIKRLPGCLVEGQREISGCHVSKTIVSEGQAWNILKQVLENCSRPFPLSSFQVQIEPATCSSAIRAQAQCTG